MKNNNRYIYYFLLASFLFSQDANHLIFNKISIKPTQSEIIEIYNPLDSDIDLSNYYLSDQDEYYKWINGTMGTMSMQDFLIRFPSGAIITSGSTLTVTTQSFSDFFDYYGYESDISIIDSNFEESEIGASPNLSDTKEMLILFYCLFICLPNQYLNRLLRNPLRTPFFACLLTYYI